MIKFNKHNVTNTETKEKVRVRYSIGNRIDGRACVNLYAKDYGSQLSKIFPNDYKNDTDGQSDYFETDRVTLFATHPLYQDALVVATEWKKHWDGVATRHEAARASRRAAVQAVLDAHKDLESPLTLRRVA